MKNYSLALSTSKFFPIFGLFSELHLCVITISSIFIKCSSYNAKDSVQNMNYTSGWHFVVLSFFIFLLCEWMHFTIFQTSEISCISLKHELHIMMTYFVLSFEFLLCEWMHFTIFQTSEIWCISHFIQFVNKKETTCMIIKDANDFLIW